MSSELKDKAIKGVAWTMIERYSGQIVQFVISIILARILTPSEYGLIGMLGIFIGLTSIFIDGGFSSALVQRKDRTDRDISTVFYINVGMAVVMYLLLFVSAPWIADFYKQPELTAIVRVYCLGLVISSLTSTSGVLLVINLDFKTTTKISLSAAFISGIIGIAMAYSGWGVWALVGQSLSSCVISAVLTVYFVRWYPKSGFSRESFRRLFSFSSKLFAATLITTVYDNITGAVIGKQFSAAALGYYNRAYGFNQLVNSNITGVLGRVSYPLLSQIQDQEDRLRQIYKRYIQMSAFLTFPLLMILCGVAKPLVLFLLTDKWSDSIILLQILSFSFMFDGVIISNLNLIRVKGRSDLILKLEIIKKAVAFTILGIAIAMDSILAICIGKAIYSVFFALYLNTYYTKKLMGYGFRDQFSDFGPYLFVSLGVLAGCLSLSYIIPDSLIALLTGVIFGLCAYGMVCKYCGLYAYKEFMNIIGPKLHFIGSKKFSRSQNNL